MRICWFPLVVKLWGSIFILGSKRKVSSEQGALITQAVQGKIKIVGLFVNQSVTEIKQIAEQVPLDYLQLHGDEPAALLAELPEIPKIKAFGGDHQAPRRIELFLQDCQKHAVNLTAILLDADAGADYGGTGKQADWDLAIQVRSEHPEIPLILAGGLNAENVANAITTVKPVAVDTASGVELSPGIKSEAQVAAFIANARQSFLAEEAS